MRIAQSLRAAIAGFAAFSLVACAQPGGPAAEQPRTVSKRSAADQRIGDENHPKIMAQFGGEVADPKIKAYIRDIGQRLARQSEQPRGPWTFTVLDSPVVNAFALPGGYVYVTRGLIALANDEAELAGVIGHEIGHVTAAHSSRRQERAGIAQLGVFAATLGAAILGGEQAARAVSELGSTVGQGYVASFSREQELEADRLGVRYIAKAGYDPLAEADFLANLQATSRLQSRIAGQGYDPNRVDFLSTHPATGQRVREAVQVAKREGFATAEGAPRRQAPFFKQISGLIYGDSPAQGFVRDRTFSHPELRFTFTVPQQFRIQNSSAQVTAIGPDGAGIVFSGDKDPGGRLDRYISEVWAPQIAGQAQTGRLVNLRRGDIGGFRSASAEMAVQTRSGVKVARMTAIRVDGSIYRFLGIQPQGADRLGRRMDQAAKSFRRLSASEARRLKPYRVKIHTVRQGDSVAKLANMQPFGDFRRERFRVLNGLKPGEGVRVGQKVKVIVE